MTKIINKKQQSINRNLSVDRERISNACIIGLYNLLGHSVTVKLPSKTSKQTLSHLSIQTTKVNGMEVNEMIEKQYHFPMVMDKNKRRDKEVIIFNMISQIVAGNHYKLAKRTTTVKTIKLNIFREIAFLNKNGMRMFGMKVIENIMKRSPSGRCSQKSYVELKEYDPEIMEIMKEVIENKNNINEHLISEYSTMYKGIFKLDQSDSSIGEVTGSIHERSVTRGVFTFSDSRWYRIEYADWFQ